MATTGWTLETLREHVESLLTSNDRRYEQRFKDSGTAVDAALNAAKEAVLKAEIASEKRFESVNEFRQALSDRDRLNMPRAEAEVRFNAMDLQLGIINKSIAERSGQHRGGRDVWGFVVGGLGVLIALAALFYKAK